MAPVDPPKNTIADIEVPDGQTAYYLCQEEEELYEEKYDGGFGAPVDVGIAKPGTNAAYLLLRNEKRVVYCLEEDNTIKDFEFDTEEWEWVEGNLAQLALTASPATEFAAVSRDGKKEREVFFQGPSGSILSVCTDDNGHTWDLSDYLPETNPVVGASLCALKVRDQVHVFYAHQSHSVHSLIFDGGTWRDELVPASTQEVPISAIYAKLHGPSYMLQFCDPDGNVYLVSDGESVKLGEVINGRVKVDKDAQSDRFPVQIKSTVKVKGAT